jgi:hypothetical protein
MFERHWLQNDLSAVCTENLITITRLARTFQSTRTRRCREQYMPLVTFCLRHFLADSIICMYVFNFRQAQPPAFLQNPILGRIKSQRSINDFRILHGRRHLLALSSSQFDPLRACPIMGGQGSRSQPREKLRLLGCEFFR